MADRVGLSQAQGQEAQVVDAPAGPRRRPWTRLAALVVGTGVAVASAELGLRVTGLPREIPAFDFLSEIADLRFFERDPLLFWRLRGDGRILHSNELGVRGYAPPLEKAERDVRIVCLGDSCTFGAGVRHADVYAIDVERRLQRANPDRRIDCVLGANGAYTTHQDRLLFEQRLAAYRPDVTVFYCGLFNDWTPAQQRTDRERSAGGLRLARLFERTDPDDYAALHTRFMQGEPAAEPRVPLADFRDNVASMMQLARDIDSAIVVIVPPRSLAMRSRWTAWEPYDETLLELATSFGARVVDVNATLRDDERRRPDAWIGDASEAWPTFVDVGHPSTLGHARLADAAVGPIADALGVRARADDADPIPVRGALQRTEVPCWANEWIDVLGDGVGEADRAWIGATWIAEVQSVDANHVRLRVTDPVPPGDHDVFLRARDTLVRCANRVTVTGPRLDVTCSPLDDGTGSRVVATGTGVAGYPVFVWIDAAVRPTPTATRYGDWGLTLAGRPAELPDAPFRFDRNAPLLQGEVAADGTWRLELDTPEPIDPAVPVFAQALVFRPRTSWVGALSPVATVRFEPR